MKKDVRYDLASTPLGSMLLVACDEALMRIDFDDARYRPVVGANWRRVPQDPVLRAARAQLGEYFAGRRTRFELPLAPLGTGFQRAVWAAIGAVPFGATIAYGELAARVGRADCARAAGAATGRNPWAIVVPCHRIVGADGALTGYAGGLERKRALLALEARPASWVRAA